MGWRFSLDEFEGKKLVSRLTANNIAYNPDKPGVWTARRWVIRELKDDKEYIRSSNKEPLDTVIPLDPADFLISEGEQETMTSPELSAYIDKQKARGMDNLKTFEVEYHKRIAMSFAAFILTVIGVSLSSRKAKGGMGLSLGIGLALSFSYILFQSISSAFADQMPIALAAWLPNIIYSIIATMEDDTKVILGNYKEKERAAQVIKDIVSLHSTFEVYKHASSEVQTQIAIQLYNQGIALDVYEIPLV